MRTYKPEDVELAFGTDYLGRQEAVLGNYSTRFLHDHRRVTRERMFWGLGAPEPLRRWMLRVQQTRMQMAEEWTAIERAESGEDVPDPVVMPEDVPEPTFSTSELEALRAIGVKP